MLKLAAELVSRRAAMAEHMEYIKGERRGLKFATEKFAEYHADRFKDFSDNWCLPVLQAPAERITPLGIRVGANTREADQDLQRVWLENDADRQASESIMLTLGLSRGFALVWGNPDDEQTPDITFEHPSSVIVAYDSENRRRKKAALKLWTDGDLELATLYTPDALWKWKRRRTSESGLILPASVEGSLGSWEQRHPTGDDTWPLPNPMGKVPVVEYRNMAFLADDPMSDIAGVESMQDAMNLVWAYLFTSLDYASLPQRVLLSAEVPKVPVLDDNGQVIGTKPVDLKRLMNDRIMFVPGENAKASQWDPAKLDVFTDVLTKMLEHVASRTRTPAHYLIQKGGNPASFDSLLVSDAGLVTRTNERIGYLNAPQRELHELVALAQGDKAKATAIRATGKPLWADTQFRSDAAKVDAFGKFRSNGMPLEWCLEWYGLAPDEVQRVMKMAVDELDDPQLRELMLKDKAQQQDQAQQDGGDPSAVGG
jgi:hypothetical protein